MKMDDILWEIHRRKEEEISQEENKEMERIDKEVRKSPAFKQAAVQLGKLVALVRQHGFKIRETYSSVDLDKIHIEAGSAEAERKFREKREKMEKAFLELKIAIATAGKAEQQNAIKGFMGAAF